MLATAITIPVTNASKQENSTMSRRSIRILAPPLRLPVRGPSWHFKSSAGNQLGGCWRRHGDCSPEFQGRRRAERRRAAIGRGKIDYALYFNSGLFSATLTSSANFF